MDLIKTGKFISALRKERGLTQEQLGERIGVTNKTISRWETGTYLPPADELLILSELFGVTINELLCGKRLEESEYKAAAEENLKETIGSSCFTLKEKTDYFKKKWLREHLAFPIITGALIAAVIAAGIILGNALIAYSSVPLSLLFYCIGNNRMMAYVERNVYDGKGNNS